MPQTDTETRSANWITTPNLRVAAVAKAAGGTLVDINRSNPERVVFSFTGLPADFEQAIFNGSLLVSAGAVISALDTLHGFVARDRPRRK